MQNSKSPGVITPLTAGSDAVNAAPVVENCYAERLNKRLHWVSEWNGERKLTSDQYWQQPYKWDEQAQKSGEQVRVFAGSLCDVFDDSVPVHWHESLWEVITETQHLTWLLLTKRPENISKLYSYYNRDDLNHVWIGISASTQEELTRGLPFLMKSPASIKFLSLEPLLELVSIGFALEYLEIGTYPDWVIVGGESGPNARPMRKGWVERIINECNDNNIPVFFKQWGEWGPKRIKEKAPRQQTAGPCEWHNDWMYMNGTKVNGCELDGKIYHDFPEI